MLRNLEWKPTYLAICICQFIRDVKAVEGHTLSKSKSICIVGYNTILDTKKIITHDFDFVEDEESEHRKKITVVWLATSITQLKSLSRSASYLKVLPRDPRTPIHPPGSGWRRRTSST